MSPKTRPIGANTTNFALNMTHEERGFWGRFAFQNDASLNQTIQQLAVERLAQIEPALAAEIEKFRKARGVIVTISKTATCIALAFLMLVAGSDRRGGRRKDDMLEFAAGVELEMEAA